MNRKQEGTARRWLGGGQPKVGGNLGLLLQAQQLLKFQGPPTPLNSAGTATRIVRRGMKCGVSMSSQSSTHISAGIVHYQNKLKFPWVTVHEGGCRCAPAAGQLTRRFLPNGKEQMRGEESSR